jgi:hypothetical protein
MKHGTAYYFPIIAVLIGLFCLSSCNPRFVFHPDLDAELIRLASLDETQLPDVLQNIEREDAIISYYRDRLTRESTLSFFTSMTHSRNVAEAILANADKFSVPPSLAFALAYEESKFAVDAFNRNGDSVDRGIFQLNSRSFPKLGRSDFYDPAVNARFGVSHLQFCLREGGNEVTALAMYNAGHNRVAAGGTPRRTLDYINRVLKYEENISSLFAARVIAGRGLRVTMAR